MVRESSGLSISRKVPWRGNVAYGREGEGLAGSGGRGKHVADFPLGFSVIL